MPTRIKPLQKLPPCTLTLESLEKITALIESSFQHPSAYAYFSATDDIWDIYGEGRDSFLNEIATREKLDSFTVGARSLDGSGKELKIVFDEKEAKVTYVADTQQAAWFEHFMFDLRRSLLPPSFVQMLVPIYGQKGFAFNLRLAALAIPINPSLRLTTPYCKIVIQQKPPNPFIENIKANIVSNIIWAILVFILGILSTIIFQQLSK